MRSGWIYLIAVLLMLLVGGMTAGGYVLLRQQSVVGEMAEETRLLVLRAERLEALVQEQETRDILAQQTAEDRLVPAEKPRKGAPAAVPPATAGPDAAGEPTASVGAEPQVWDRLVIQNVEQRLEGGDLVVSFDLMNQRGDREPAMGYITVVARGQRQGKPWIEAWPPMRLTPLGRPQNYRRGTPFSVQRYRRVRARVAAVNDKQFEALEFVVSSRQGQLRIVQAQPVSLAKGPKRTTSQESAGRE